MVARLQNSSLSIEVADPEDPELDDLDLGASDDAEALAGLLASRWWAALDPAPTLYRFSDADGSTVGFAVVRDDDMRHPTHQSTTYASLVVIWNFVVLSRYQKKPEPVSGATFAAEALRALEELVLPTTDAVGMALAVRQGNAAARGLYERVGFEYDNAGPFWDDDDWYLVMRKLRS